MQIVSRRAVTAAFGLSPLLSRAQTATSAWPQKIHAEIAAFQGTVSLYAKNLDSGKTFGIREDERVRTASTIKLAIMTEVFGAVAEGRAQWSEAITLRDSDKVSGSGVIREFSDGVKLPIRDLVHVMIVVSDNTATNLLIDRFTADAVNARMDKMGFPQTRSMRKVRGDGQNLKAPSGFSKAGKDPANQRFGLGSTTPHEMVRLLEMMERGEAINSASSREMIAILERQQYKDGIGRHTGDLRVASKSGSLDALRSDAGVVYSPGGRIILSITCDDIPKIDESEDNPGLLLISRLTGLLLSGLSRTA